MPPDDFIKDLINSVLQVIESALVHGIRAFVSKGKIIVVVNVNPTPISKLFQFGIEK